MVFAVKDCDPRGEVLFVLVEKGLDRMHETDKFKNVPTITFQGH